MPAADTAKTRTVGDIMSTPVIVAAPDDKVAEAAARMREQRVGSVVVVDDSRPGRHPDRARPRAHRRRRRRHRDRDRPRLDDREPRLGRARRRRGRPRSPASPQHGYRHIPVVDHDEVVGIVSMRDLMRIAQIQPAENLAHEIPRGLEGVVVAETDDRRRARPRRLLPLPPVQRGRARREALARGRLVPDVRGRAADEGRGRGVPPPRRAAARDPGRGQARAPRDRAARVATRRRSTCSARRSRCSARTSASGRRSTSTTAELQAQALQVCAVVPTLLTAIYRLQHDLEPIDPDPELAYAANYLYMLSGEVPPPEHARAVEQYLISTIDHGFNASTFTARVITSTGADLAAAVTGAIGALSGPLHGGAPSRALDMLDAIGTIDNAEPWLRDAVERGDRLMGFGHRVYKTDDPRSVMLRGVAEQLGGDKVELAKQIEAQGDRGARRAQAGPEALHERRVLRRHRDGHAPGCPGRCSRRRSRRAG